MQTREIANVLSNPESCFNSLGGKTVALVNAPNVPQIFRMSQGAPVAISKFTAQPTLNNSPTLFIKTMRIKSIDLNGQGDRAIATLEVIYNKPKSTMGGQEIVKDITLNANTCDLQLSDGTHTTAIAVKDWCSGLGGKLIEGPSQFEISPGVQGYKGTCQTCNAATAAAKVIHACQSSGTGGGIDLSSVDAIICSNLGGSYNDADNICEFGVPPVPFDEHISRLASANLPQCIMIPASVCPSAPAVHTVASGSPESISTTNQSTITMYNRTCTGQYERKCNACLCATNYSGYAHTTRDCTTTTSSSSGSCNLDSSILTCYLCDGICFNKTSESCVTTGQYQQNQTNPGSITMIKCCKP